MTRNAPYFASLRANQTIRLNGDVLVRIKWVDNVGFRFVTDDGNRTGYFSQLGQTVKYDDEWAERPAWIMEAVEQP